MERTAKDLLRDLIREQKLAVLCTSGADQSSGGPYASLVAFAASGDLTRLYFATKRNTTKFANIAADPRVALLIDGRKNRSDDLENAVAATAIGTAVELIGDARAPAARILCKDHPPITRFIQKPSCAVIQVAVQRYVVAAGLEKVSVVETASQ